MSKNQLSENKINQADISNWRAWPFNRSAFHNVNEFITTEVVEKDATFTSELKNTPNTGIESILRPHLSDMETDSIVILHKGEVAYEYYANGNEGQTPHILMSATKSVVGLIAGMLESKGYIDLNAFASVYIPQIIGTVYEQVTLQELLDMRAGVIFNKTQQETYDLATNWVPIPSGCNQLNLLDFFSSLKDAEKIKDDPFRYVSANYDLLGLVIERATGQKMKSILSEFLWKPIGAQSNAYLTVDIDRFPRSTGGFCTTVMDFARIGQLIANGGTLNSKQIIPISVIEDILNNGDHEAWRDGQWGEMWLPISNQMSYRNGWYVDNKEPKMLFAMGVFGQNLFIDWANNIVIAKFSSWKEESDYRALALTHQLVGKIRHLLMA
jgi:CubicO group peptidase (beta-lactamase class C family)